MCLNIGPIGEKASQPEARQSGARKTIYISGKVALYHSLEVARELTWLIH